MRRAIVLSVFLGVLVYSWCLDAASEVGPRYVVIANKSVNGESLSADDLRKIYLGKKRFWKGDSSVAPAKMRKGNTDENFLKEVVQKTPSQFRIYWKRAVFTGKRVPYKVFESQSELLDYVANTEGAVGYIESQDEASLPDGLKVMVLQ